MNTCTIPEFLSPREISRIIFHPLDNALDGARRFSSFLPPFRGDEISRRESQGSPFTRTEFSTSNSPESVDFINLRYPLIVGRTGG